VDRQDLRNVVYGGVVNGMEARLGGGGCEAESGILVGVLRKGELRHPEGGSAFGGLVGWGKPLTSISSPAPSREKVPRGFAGRVIYVGVLAKGTRVRSRSDITGGAREKESPPRLSQAQKKKGVARSSSDEKRN